jgi:hypothetical protein
MKGGLTHCGTIFDIVKVLNCDAVLSIVLSFAISLNDFAFSFASYLNNSTWSKIKLVYDKVIYEETYFIGQYY